MRMVLRSLLKHSLITMAIVTMLNSAHTSAQTPQGIGVKETQMHPDFLLPTIDGRPARLSDFRGKKVLLFNFASW